MIISEDNFLDYCQRAYRNNHCISNDEFLEDLKTLKYIKALLRKHISNKDINPLLLINHLICFYNVFDRVSATQIILYRLEDYYWPAAKSILNYMNTTPESFISCDHTIIYTDDIVECEILTKKLNNLNIKKYV